MNNNIIWWKLSDACCRMFPMKNYLKVVLSSIVIFSIAIAITIIPTKGIWIYYGDFNVQQIPFYIHLHDLIRSGNLLGYDWCTDLGGSVIGCYSFYILGSPFFWLTIPFKSEAVPYLIPWINVIKYAVMSATAYAYLKRHTKTWAGAYMGALLFSFSGYCGAVLTYNHFHDVVAFFPLYLLCFEKCMEEKKRIGFILMTALMAIINYYFFFGEVVFLVIYFFCKRYEFKKIWRALYCGIIGVLLDVWYLIPATYYTLGNNRLSQTVQGYGLLSYSDSSMLLGIIKNTVMLSDLSGLNSMFNPAMSRVSGVGAYLPLFSIGGVIAYLIICKKNKDELTEYDKWPRRVLLVSVIFAAIPVLNQLFSALNAEYYARWYFMPILIMALVTGRVLEDALDTEKTLRPLMVGNYIVGIISAFFILCAVLPAKNDDGEWTLLGLLKNYEQLGCQIAFAILTFGALFFLLKFVFARLKKIETVCVIVWTACLATCVTMMVEGDILVENERANSYIEQGIKGAQNVELPESDDWYRIETEEDVYNYPMIWNRSCVTSFISTIPFSTIDFYAGLGLTRKVTSKLGITRVGARTLLGSKYYLIETQTPVEHIGHVEDVNDMTYFRKVGDTNGFDIYENLYFVPMGISFDEFVLEEDYVNSEASSSTRDKLLMKAIILDTDTALKYAQYMTQYPLANDSTVTLQMFKMEVEKRRESACTDFTATKDGFTAKAHMPKTNLLFFSVPYERGFKAYVDGVETQIEKADMGFMAILVPEGDHDIEFTYNVFSLPTIKNN